jgi:hypothetical protein
MTSTDIENLPASWDDARDVPFFRITAALFSPEFCFGAGTLLASYDDSIDFVPATQAEDGSSAATTAAGSDSQPVGDLIPVRVRRIA